MCLFTCIFCFFFSFRVVLICLHIRIFSSLVLLCFTLFSLFFFFKQKTAYDMRISDWSSDVCSSDLNEPVDLPASIDSTTVRDFQQGWLELKDTHDFFGLLRKYGLNREKAMHIAPEGHAIQAGTEQLTEIFEKASERQLPIMVFTNSAGCVQIHTGLVQRLVTAGLWFNVLDPDFNLHLRLEGVASVWLVRKPTTDGIVTGIEAFNSSGELIVQLFGKRKPGIPEDPAWRSLTGEVFEIRSTTKGLPYADSRSEELRVGKECGSRCRMRWAPEK